jgi:hypothetical protein
MDEVFLFEQYWGTPYRINYVFDGRPREYLPDYVGTLSDGGLLIAEAGRQAEKS